MAPDDGEARPRALSIGDNLWREFSEACPEGQMSKIIRAFIRDYNEVSAKDKEEIKQRRKVLQTRIRAEREIILEAEQKLQDLEMEDRTHRIQLTLLSAQEEPAGPEIVLRPDVPKKTVAATIGDF